MKTGEYIDVYAGVAKVALIAIGAAVLSGCVHSEDPYERLDSQVEAVLAARPTKWMLACGVVQKANPHCETEYDRTQLEEWRKRWKKEFKTRYMRQVLPEINRIRDIWMSDGKLNLVAGDRERESLLGRMAKELPKEMNDCLKLADMQMGSDRNIARMKEAFGGFMRQVEACDVNGGPASIKKLDEIHAGYTKVCRWHGKVDEFMTKLSDMDVVTWYPVRPATYKRDSIAPMESVRDEFVRQYTVKLWTVRVYDRRNDYANLQKLAGCGQYAEMMKILAAHDLIVKPEGVAGIIDFDDAIERAKVANGGLANHVAKLLVAGGLEGVQYHRRTRRGLGRGVYSMLVVGRAPVDEAGRDRRKSVRKAFKVARMAAEVEYSKFLETIIDSFTEQDIELKDGETLEQFKEHLRQVSKSTLKDMVVVARAMDGDEVVIVLGWRNPEVGNALMGERFDEFDGVEVSPSFGAYL